MHTRRREGPPHLTGASQNFSVLAQAGLHSLASTSVAPSFSWLCPGRLSSTGCGLEVIGVQDPIMVRRWPALGVELKAKQLLSETGVG